MKLPERVDDDVLFRVLVFERDLRIGSVYRKKELISVCFQDITE